MITGPIARQTLRTSVVLALRLTVQAGTLLVVARMLGPHLFGLFAGVSALALMLGTLSTFGTHITLMGAVARSPTTRNEALRTAIPTTLLCGIVLLAIYWVIVLLFLNPSSDAYQAVFLIGISEISLQPLLSLAVNEQVGLGQAARSQMLATLPLGLRLSAAAITWYLEPVSPLNIYSWGYLAATAIAVTTNLVINPWPRPSTWQQPTIGQARHTVGYAVLNFTANSPGELDKTLALRLLPQAAAGIYSAGARIIGALALPIMAMMLSTLPRLFRHDINAADHTRKLLIAVYATSLGYGLLLSSILWIFAPVFDELFGETYKGLAECVRWLCFAIPGMSLRIATGSVLMAFGKPWMRIGFEVLGLIILAGAALTLTTSVGMIGMPIALACSEWAMGLVGGPLVLVSWRAVQRGAYLNSEA